MSDYSADKLSRSQVALLHAFESNQSAVLDRITSMMESVRDQQTTLAENVAEITALIGGMSRQIDHMFERQEMLERQITFKRKPFEGERGE